MVVSETVILPLPNKVKCIQEAAHHFGEQYGCVPWIEVRGQVQLEHGERCVIETWQTVGMLDLELGLIGFGVPRDDEEALRWMVPIGPGEFRLSEMEEEN